MNFLLYVTNTRKLTSKKTEKFFVSKEKSFIRTTPVVNFINILVVAFSLIFLRQKITKPNCKKKKTVKNGF